MSTRTSSPTASRSPTPPQSPSPIRVRRRKTVAAEPHPVLQAAAREAATDFWRDVLDRAAQGKWPIRGISFDGTTVVLKRGKQIWHHNIAEQTPSELAESLPEFLRSYGRVSAPGTDGGASALTLGVDGGALTLVEKAQSSAETRSGTVTPDSIPSLPATPTPSTPSSTPTPERREFKRTRGRVALLDGYVRGVARQHDLNRATEEQLRRFIHMAFALKMLSSRDVQFMTGGIASISGLVFDDEKAAFFVAPEHLERRRQTKEPKERAGGFIGKWERFLEAMAKRLSLPSKPPAASPDK